MLQSKSEKTKGIDEMRQFESKQSYTVQWAVSHKQCSRLGKGKRTIQIPVIKIFYYFPFSTDKSHISGQNCYCLYISSILIPIFIFFNLEISQFVFF